MKLNRLISRSVICKLSVAGAQSAPLSRLFVCRSPTVGPCKKVESFDSYLALWKLTRDQNKTKAKFFPPSEHQWDRESGAMFEAKTWVGEIWR